MTKEEAEAQLARYTTRVQKINNGPGRWDYLTVEILLDGEPVGSYQRNYASLFNTFVPFVHRDASGNHHILALYSRHYTASRLMRLPECVDLGGEEPSGGFCPTDFLVPYDPAKGLFGQFGFMSGCVWGDDSSWKIRYIDLAEAAQGVLKPDGRLGFLELPRNLGLRQCVNLELYDGDDEYGEIEFTISRTYFTKQKHYNYDCDGKYIDDDDVP